MICQLMHIKVILNTYSDKGSEVTNIWIRICFSPSEEPFSLQRSHPSRWLNISFYRKPKLKRSLCVTVLPHMASPFSDLIN